MQSDIVAALKWTKENIRDFNGDPDNVFRSAIYSYYILNIANIDFLFGS